MFNLWHSWFGVRWYIYVNGTRVLVYATSVKAAVRLATAKYDEACRA